ncbi:Branched-chain amino acid aminotransferase [[Actinomadura] parvosata subsp. kistnae]|uniref:Branched-chain-amino-acid aminotransferase n=1 Tax=[Actinomadura] parvosata subsp. kistnae TaxID=1909395 RepID=A0A1V0AFW8_9ACTN|nr:branched-chain amino acid aminotransferase [Nonomuraea sp. ATCC 55076]AQZ69131.1 branched chain amino acid aminotransferase [Nonomuraea sp. ATCC 55076]SPL92285.1 Branched-chain amino acid aminotransferase [Actinomadura parvosata subsp. kistnae]
MTIAQKLSFDVQLSDHARTAAEREQVLANPGFGQTFTDHMISIDYTDGEGWHDARLMPYGPLSLDPATSVFHYAQELFEGLKAYRQISGSIVTFRPYANAARFNRSAARMAMPELPEETFVESLELLVEHDKEWVPTTEGHSLYLRPFMIATQAGLGVNYPSKTYKYMVIASPAASYFTGGIKPVSVWLSTEYTRAAPGGTGFAKCGGNYAAAFVAQRQAVENGCDQVVWLDAHEHRYVEEMGGMNLFFVFGDKLVTPALTGTLLPGITRESILELAGDLGLETEERLITVDEWQEASASGDLTEVFACGTAAVVTPVGTVKGADRSWTVADGTPGPVTMRVREELVGIQYGARPDTHNWIHKIG